MQEKQDQKVVFVFLSIHTNFKHEEHEQRTQKNKKPKPHCLSHSHFLRTQTIHKLIFILFSFLNN